MTGIVCKKCGKKDCREFLILGGWVTFVCPGCAFSWTEPVNLQEVKI